MPGRIPTPGIPTPAVRKSPTAHPAMKPVENMGKKMAKPSLTRDQQIGKAQDTLMKSRLKGRTYDSSGTN